MYFVLTVDPMVEWLRSLISLLLLSFQYLSAVSNIGFSPAHGTCEISQVLLVGGFLLG